MGRHLYFPVTGLPPGKVIQTTEGGTSADNQPQALANLNGVPVGSLGISSGLISLNNNIKIDDARLPNGYGGNYQGPMVEGVTSLVINSITEFVITDYDVFTNYVISAISGNVTRSNNIITYTAPAVAGSGGFILNGKNINVTIVATATVQKPVILTPHNETYDVRGYLDITSSEFKVGSGVATHIGSDWQIATDVAFTTIVNQLTNDATNKTTWSINLLNNDQDYYIRVRYKGSGAYGYSAWSDIVHIKTTTNAIVAKPSIDPAQFSGQVLSDGNVTITSSAFSLLSGSDTHQGTDWQIALDPNFDVIIKQTINNTTDKVSRYFVNLTLGITYYVRVRYKGTTSGYSEWSVTQSFTTV